jgi:hypothetical protein
MRNGEHASMVDACIGSMQARPARRRRQRQLTVANRQTGAESPEASCVTPPRTGRKPAADRSQDGPQAGTQSVHIMPHAANSHYIASMLESVRVARSAHGRQIFIARSLHSEPVEVRSGPR